MPITLTNADFDLGWSKQFLKLSGDYNMTITSDKPGPGVEVRIYEWTDDFCTATHPPLDTFPGPLPIGMVAGDYGTLGYQATTSTTRVPPVENGCYQVDLSNLLDANVTVTLSAAPPTP